MKKEYEEQYHRMEDNHWWFRGRRHLVHSLLLQAVPNRTCDILEIGCSGGPLIQQLHADGYTNVTGIDISEEAIGICQKNGLSDTHVMDAQALAFPDNSFNIVIASDVLEHLSDASQALCEWRRVLKPDGMLIVFVPAFQFLWSFHDELNRHFKRYRQTELRELLTVSGFIVVRSSYWNSILFSPVACIRIFRGLFPERDNLTGDIRPTLGVLNTVLYWILLAENSTIMSGLNLPVGVSVMAIGHKPEVDMGQEHSNSNTIFQ